MTTGKAILIEAPGVEGFVAIFTNGFVHLDLWTAEDAPSYSLSVLNPDGSRVRELKEICPGYCYQTQLEIPEAMNCRVVLQERWPGGNGRVRWSQPCDPEKW